LLAVLLYTKKANHSANTVLAIAVLALSIDIFHSVYIVFEYYFTNPHFIGFTFAFPLLYGPIFYFYAKLISSNGTLTFEKVFPHFIPFILAIFYGVIFVYFESSEFKISLVHSKENQLPGVFLLDYLKPIHGIAYVIFTLKVVLDFDKKIKNSFSNIDKINLDWLKYLTIGLSIIWSIVLLSYIVDAISDKEIVMDHLIYLAASILIYTIGYLSLRQPQILTQVSNDLLLEDKVVEEENEDERKTYKKSGLTNSEAEEYLENLLNVFEVEKPYLNNDLNLQDLAAMASLSTHNLSEIINTKLNRNFYDFINSYRVKEVQRRLKSKDAEIYSILAIALESGFNSKSSFNTTFKKHAGITPSQFRVQTKST
jgi:AraC-like DNA-binding protein